MELLRQGTLLVSTSIHSASTSFLANSDSRTKKTHLSPWSNLDAAQWQSDTPIFHPSRCYEVYGKPDTFCNISSSLYL